jgi:sulfite oxidase
MTPERSLDMTEPLRPRIVHDAEGFNTAGDPAVVAASLVTPLDEFYTRSHAPPPPIDAAAWRLTVDGLVSRELLLSLDDLRRFARRDVTATLLCAGLRRNELVQVAPLPGELPWGPEPAATARWTGVALAEVLDAAGVLNEAHHIGFTGLDAVTRHGSTFGFGGSISVGKARDEDVLLAFEQNGKPLRAAHGFPLRVIVPGWIGARSVKWLGRISVLRDPSDNYFQTHAYRIQREVDPLKPTDVTRGVPISEVNLNAVVLQPASDTTVPAGAVTLHGWAIGTAGAPITNVEWSLDDGRTWTAAELSMERARWSWTLWQATLALDTGVHTVVVRAHDTTGAAQPASLGDAWNAKGYMNNSWHRVRVAVV